MLDLVTLIGTRLPRAAAPWFPDVAWRIPTRERIAYLTFDDGPNPDLTERITAILDRHDARATFFLVGAHAERHRSLVRLLVDAGHTVGNHTYSHVDGWRTKASELAEEMERTTGVLEDAAGRHISWMRPPYGRFTRPMRNWCRARGQTLTMWDVGTGDYLKRVDDRHVLRHVEAYIRPGSVIVLHDNPCCAGTTLRALGAVLERLTAQGWRFPALPAGT